MGEVLQPTTGARANMQCRYTHEWFMDEILLASLSQEGRAPAQAPGDQAAASGGERILVVDDNRDAADTLCMFLRTKGHDVRVAYDGVEGVGAAMAFKPQVVLLDIGLPKMFGYEVAREIREKLGSSVLIVAVTGYGQEEDRRRSKEAGFDYHFTKPVDLVDLERLFAVPRP